MIFRKNKIKKLKNIIKQIILNLTKLKKNLLIRSIEIIIL